MFWVATGLGFGRAATFSGKVPNSPTLAIALAGLVIVERNSGGDSNHLDFFRYTAVEGKNDLVCWYQLLTVVNFSILFFLSTLITPWAE